MKKVLVIEVSAQERFSLLLEGGGLIIGDGADEIDVHDLHLTRIQCEVEVNEDQVLVSRPASVLHDGTNAAPERRRLDPGEAVHVGQARLRLEPLQRQNSDAGPADDVLHPTVADPTPSPAQLSGMRLAVDKSTRKHLLVIDGADHKQSFPLPESGCIRIGNSGKHADICLHDLYVSRLHCQLELHGDKVIVTHAEGKNGTLINGERILQASELKLGDILRVGNSHLRLETASDHPGPGTPIPGKNEQAPARAAVPAAGCEQMPAPAPTGETSPEPDAFGLAGQTLGHYRIGPPLGRGHSGQSYRAQDLKTNQNVTLKVLAPEFPANSTELQKFAQALKTATPLQHVNLVSLYGAGKSGQHCWIAREYVEGECVDRLVPRLKEEGKLTWTRAVRVAVHLGNALAYLHEHKAVHGNITPRNVLIGGDKVTKLSDLMLASALAGSRLHQSILEKKLLAELPYLAPEQVDPDAFVDHLADLYAVGAVIYALATGEPPFTGASPEVVIDKVREAPVTRPSRYQRKIPFAFEGVILKLLAKRQEDRYQTATELLADLDVLAHDQQIKV